MELSELKELVRSRVTTQADIAEEIGISYSTLTKWMAKNEKPPKKAALKLIENWAEKQNAKD